MTSERRPHHAGQGHPWRADWANATAKGERVRDVERETFQGRIQQLKDDLETARLEAKHYRKVNRATEAGLREVLEDLKLHAKNEERLKDDLAACRERVSEMEASAFEKAKALGPARLAELAQDALEENDVRAERDQMRAAIMVAADTLRQGMMRSAENEPDVVKAWDMLADIIAPQGQVTEEDIAWALSVVRAWEK